VQALLANYFADRFLAFQREAAVVYASLASSASARGYSISVGDCQSPPLPPSNGFAVATRDTAPFRAPTSHNQPLAELNNCRRTPIGTC